MANGWPGLGLLLLRTAVLLFSLYNLCGIPARAESLGQQAPLWLAAAAGLFLLVGLWTPAMGIMSALSELGIASWGPSHFRSALLAAAISAALAMLEPGAWSIDALLFGRKSIMFTRKN